jgi:hypothetical protein
MQLTEAEASFRALKSELSIRPLFHQLEPRVKAHVLVAFPNFFRSLIDRAKSIPAVTAAAVTDALPLHNLRFSSFSIQGRPEPPTEALPIADQSDVSPGYFQAIGLRLETGRWFTDRDLETAGGAHPVVAVNRAFVRKFFPGENPLGKILVEGDKKINSQIVALVSDYRALGAESDNRPTIFHVTLALPPATLLVRGGGAAHTLAAQLRDAVWALDRNLPAAEVVPMEHYVDEWLSQRRFNTMLLEVFAGLALILAMIGIYGVLSNLVSSRVREIGIRLAMGARPADITSLVLRQSLYPIAAGVALGLAGSLILSQLLESLLFQVHARDPLTIALASSTVVLISPAALYFLCAGRPRLIASSPCTRSSTRISGPS